MSLKKMYLFFAFIIIYSCSKNSIKDFNSMDEKEKKKLSKSYHDMSNYFLQPSELYRTYKDSALMVQPENVDYMQRLSYSYKKVGEHIKAMKILNKAVDIDTSNGKTDVLEYRAWTLLYYYRDYEGTVRDVNLIEKITGNSYNSCWGEPCGFHKGQALYKLNRYEEAIESFKIVNVEEEKLGFNTNDNYLILFYIGRCYFEMNDFEKAIENFEKAIASVEQFPEAYYQLALIYKETGDIIEFKKNINLATKYINYSMNEPYVERFDELFPHMIGREINSIIKHIY